MRARGFSLVETMAAVALLGIITGSLVSLSGTVWKGAWAARRSAEVVDILQSVLERERAARSDQWVSVARQPAPGRPGYSYAVAVNDLEKSHGWKNMRQVLVTVYLDSDPSLSWSQDLLLSEAVSEP